MSNVTLWAQPAWSTDRWVRDFFGRATASDWGKDINLGIHPAVEVARDGDDAVIRLDLPGVDPEKDINVEVDKGRLIIRGERRDERTEEHSDQGAEAATVRKLSEVRYGSFHRSFALPGHVTGDAVSASYDAGVLKVRVTGAHKGAEAQRIAVESK